MGLASLPFQILVYLNSWLTAVFVIIELASMIYKGLILPYPSGILPMEIIFILLYPMVDVCRLFFGIQASGWKYSRISRYNGKQDSKSGWNRCIHGFEPPSCWLSHLLYPISNLRVSNELRECIERNRLYLDLVMNCINLGVIGLEFILSIWCLISFIRA